MTKENAIKLFEDKQVRSVWDEDAEKWYISIVDVVSVLTDSVDGRKYWNKLKQRLKEEGGFGCSGAWHEFPAVHRTTFFGRHYGQRLKRPASVRLWIGFGSRLT